MKKYLKSKLNNEKGMTLIELLAVIVIIAIIAAIAIPAIGNIIENSRVGAMKADALSAFSAVELYLAENSEDTSVTTVELTDGGYLDDLGSFTTGPSFTRNTAGDLVMAGVATNGGVTLTFEGATKQNVTDLSNSQDNIATGPIRVSGR